MSKKLDYDRMVAYVVRECPSTIDLRADGITLSRDVGVAKLNPVVAVVKLPERDKHGLVAPNTLLWEREQMRGSGFAKLVDASESKAFFMENITDVQYESYLEMGLFTVYIGQLTYP